MNFDFNDVQFEYFEDERCEKVATRCLKTIYITFFVFFVIFIALFCAFQSEYYFIRITGRSMQPTLNPDITMQSEAQDYCIVDKDGELDYGDIVIIRSPSDPDSDQTIIKRVLAFGGDKISIFKSRDENGEMYYHFARIKSGTNEVEILEEDYIKMDGDLPAWESLTSYVYNNVIYERNFFRNYFSINGRFYSSSRTRRVTVDGVGSVLFYQLEEDEIFYMGDNRSNSTDGREYGPVKVSDMVIGKVVKIVENGAYSDLFFVRGYYQLKGILEYFFPKLLDYFAWNG